MFVDRHGPLDTGTVLHLCEAGLSQGLLVNRDAGPIPQSIGDGGILPALVIHGDGLIQPEKRIIPSGGMDRKPQNPARDEYPGRWGETHHVDIHQLEHLCRSRPMANSVGGMIDGLHVVVPRIERELRPYKLIGLSAPPLALEMNRMTNYHLFMGTMQPMHLGSMSTSLPQNHPALSNPLIINPCHPRCCVATPRASNNGPRRPCSWSGRGMPDKPHAMRDSPRMGALRERKIDNCERTYEAPVAVGKWAKVTSPDYVKCAMPT